jgi:hypothetical protein
MCLYLLSWVQCFDVLVSSTNKADCHDIAEILLKVALNTIMINQARTNNVNKTWALLQTTGGKVKDEPNLLGSVLLVFLVFWVVLLCVFTFCPEFSIVMSYYVSLPSVLSSVLWCPIMCLYLLIQSSPVKILAVIEKRKHLRKK